MTKPHENYTEFFNFATTHKDKNIANIYLSHFEFLTKFVSYFKAQAENIIKEGENLEFFLPHQNKKNYIR